MTVKGHLRDLYIDDDGEVHVTLITDNQEREITLPAVVAEEMRATDLLRGDRLNPERFGGEFEVKRWVQWRYGGPTSTWHEREIG